MALPDAGSKLRLVLDYLPCEACLAHPVEDQDLLCTICARVDRQVAVRVETRTTVLVERPSPSPEPILIAPPLPAPILPQTVAVRFADEPEAAPGALEVVVEPFVVRALPAPLLVALPEPAPAPIPLASPIAILSQDEPPEPAEPEFDVDDIVTFIPAFQEYFDYGGPLRREAPAVVAEPEPAPEPIVLTREAPPPEDDFVFRPPERAPEAPRREEPAMDEVVPIEEVPVESAQAEARREEWAPPPDFLAEEEPAPQAEPARREEEFFGEPEEAILEMEAVPDEEPILEMEVVEDEPPAAVPAEEEILEMEIVEDEEPAPQPVSAGDLWRLRGYDTASDAALGRSGITSVVHLSGHDAGELSGRTGILFERLAPWIQVADLVQEVGVPLDAAIALVAAGIAGPKGLADADPDEVADRVSAFGGYQVHAREVRRWKRRA